MEMLMGLRGYFIMNFLNDVTVTKHGVTLFFLAKKIRKKGMALPKEPNLQVGLLMHILLNLSSIFFFLFLVVVTSLSPDKHLDQPAVSTSVVKCIPRVQYFRIYQENDVMHYKGCNVNFAICVE